MKKVKQAVSRVLKKKSAVKADSAEQVESSGQSEESAKVEETVTPQVEEKEAKVESTAKADNTSEESVEKKPIKVYKTAKQIERELQGKDAAEKTENTDDKEPESKAETAEESEEVKSEKKKPRRRKRTTKKKVEAKADESDSEITSEEKETKTEESEKPKEKDESETKESSEDKQSVEQEDSAKEGEGADETKVAKKPRRRRRSKSTKDKKPEESESEDNAEVVEEAEQVKEEPKKPVRELQSKIDAANKAKKEETVAKAPAKSRPLQQEKKQRREMLINVTTGQECRIAVVQDKKLEELYVERLDTTSLVGNIYKGKIVNIEPSIQACFVDFGIGQNGFLHISDVQTSYFKNFVEQSEKVGKKQPRKDRPLIQECLKKGQEVVVQVIKAGIGTKGPTLSSYISIPGRYVVLMPGMRHSGVSRKLSQEDRQKMKELSAELSAPDDVGIILRTASLGSNKRDLKKDFNYLIRLWKQMSKNIKKKSGPMELYKESDLVIRTVRDIFTNGIDRIYCDNEATWEKIDDFFAVAMPRSRKMVKLYSEHTPIFSRYNIEREIEKLQGKNVPLANGGSIVIESTEAMVTIDVNSGKYRDNNNAEDTAFKTNLEAADEICRQLKLRDLGGVVVIDFIDMVNNKHKRELEKVVRDLFLKDRASTRILRINQFGLMAITRQRMKASLKNRTYVSCPLCKGAGQLKSSESVAIEVMRKIAYAAEDAHVAELDVIVSPKIAEYLLNDRRQVLVNLEEENQTRILVKSDFHCGPEDFSFDARNGRGIRIDPWL